MTKTITSDLLKNIKYKFQTFTLNLYQPTQKYYVIKQLSVLKSSVINIFNNYHSAFLSQSKFVKPVNWPVAFRNL